MGRPAILEIRDVTKTWVRERTGETVHALDGISLNVERGEFLILLGPSGCGKSTLLQIIGDLEHSSGGRIVFTSQDGGRKPTTMVFQEYALFPWRTVLDNIAFGPEMRGVPRDERYTHARRYIQLVHLDGFENRYPHELSGGMKQRVALARALNNDPDMVLFDEPLAALDAQTRRVLQNELVRIWQATGKTFIYVTHSLDEAILLGDRVVVMTARPGRIKEIVPLAMPRPRALTRPAEVEALERLENLLKGEVSKALAEEDSGARED
jgi:NitT/TauT family transport system ATP-binding protein